MACSYASQGIGCACVSGNWMCLVPSRCPASGSITTGTACPNDVGLACDYPGTTHIMCGCTIAADGGSATWTCAVSAACDATQPACNTPCVGPAVCAYGNVHCACMNGAGNDWVCI
jgi:hypothetical protein